MPENLKIEEEAIKNLFLGIAPERKNELEDLWNKYSPRLEIKEDNSSILMQAGMYTNIWFTHRAVRSFWLSSFIAWEGYCAVHKSITENSSLNLNKFKNMLETFDEILNTENSQNIRLPNGIPEPGELPDKIKDSHMRAAAELAHFSVGWAFLHEIRHLQHQQENYSSMKPHKEEFSCDNFATNFLLENALDFAKTEKEDAHKLYEKRKLGILFALFCLTLLGKDQWNATKSHPATQERIDKVMEQMKCNATDMSDSVIIGAFAALCQLWKGAPRVYNFMLK